MPLPALCAYRDWPTAAIVQESAFLGSRRRTLLRTDGGGLLRIQQPVGEPVEFGARVNVATEAVPVAVRVVE